MALTSSAGRLGLKSLLEPASKMLNLGMEFSSRAAVDAGLFGAEAWAALQHRRFHNCMQSSRVIVQVKNGARIAGTWLLGMAWLGLVFAGLGVALTPSPHSPVLGWILLGVATFVFFATMDRWVKNVLPGLLAVGTLNATFCILTGHLAGLPANPISTLNALALTVFFATSTVLSLAFRNRELRLLDRLAIFTFTFCIFWQAAAQELAGSAKTLGTGVASVTVIASGIGLSALAIAYVYDRIQSHSGGRHILKP